MMNTYAIDAAQARLGRRAALRRLFALLAVGSSVTTGALDRAWGAKAPPPPPPPPPGWPPTKTVQGGVTVSPNDPAISAQAVQYPGTPVGTVLGYLSAPVGSQFYAGILVLHDALGLTEHIRDVTRRLARLGYVALAPDLLSTVGGTEKLGGVQNVLTQIQNVSQFDLLAIGNVSIRYLEAQPLVAKTRIGVLGFGFGGNLAWELLVSNADVKVGVVFDASTPDATIATQFSKPMLAIYGADDTVDSDGVKQLDEAMKKAGTPWQYKMEPKANRAFFDDSRTPYVPEAAKDAWKLTTDWLSKYLAPS